MDRLMRTLLVGENRESLTSVMAKLRWFMYRQQMVTKVPVVLEEEAQVELEVKNKVTNQFETGTPAWCPRSRHQLPR